MRPLRILLVAALTSAAWAAPPQSYEYVVRIAPLYTPDRVDVKIGDSVLWNNLDADSHTVTGEFHPPFRPQEFFDSGDLPSGSTYRYYFTRPGTWTYHCRYHPEVTGSVTVSR